ncbi:MAG: hypothetical protein BGO98_09200 [Myxococcales bacterium 68-20]|nr:hypothetical protein [Myxococcales bacterium]OJY25161.1 MAG: hypothetical protein BGO98_09200 [Myxococcales bacterium 68-20]
MNIYGRFAIVLGTLSATVVISCTENGVVGRYLDDGEAPPEFASTEDAGRDAESGSTLYCPSNRCPAGHTTCPSSEFLCDVDLLTDVNNCGECGNKCPPKNSRGTFNCAEGRCVLGCILSNALDCDGVPDNGCETTAFSDDNCGACGNKCSAGTRCIMFKTQEVSCGCKPGELDCGVTPYLSCIDPSHDDKNCGACGNACPRDGGGTVEVPPNSYFGCYDGECGALKCAGLFANCDGVTDNGCETSLLDDENCGGCGVKCQDGMTCGLSGGLANLPMCHCPQGTTFCGGSMSQGGSEVIKIGDCHDLSSDPKNCGGCGIGCTLSAGQNVFEDCVYGRCESSCKAGWGDCNGNRYDGCETRITSDPKNCGGCGIVCDGIAGQACVDGRCMVEPCDELQDAGGPTR